MKTDFTFTNITKENISNHKNLCKIFVKYKMQTLRNHGEMPGSKKMFYELFDSIISDSSFSNSDYFIVMKSAKELIGFASISTSSTDVIDIPYSYGTVNDFYVSPKHRRKGYGRILNDYIENIFKDNKTNTVLLSPDPVSGIDFWKAMGYCDTGIHQGWGRHLVYVKHLIESQNSVEIDNAISKLVTLTDLIGINPYSKPQIKEVYGVWKEYCKEAKQKPHRKDVKCMAWNARKNKDVNFKALYYNGKIIGFTYKADNEINYVFPEYKNFNLDNEIRWKQRKLSTPVTKSNQFLLTVLILNYGGSMRKKYQKSCRQNAKTMQKNMISIKLFFLFLKLL